MSPNGAPTIDAVDPSAGKPGQVVEVRGSGFGDDEGTIDFRLPGGTPVGAEVVDWGAALVKAKVPPLAQFGSGGPLELTLSTAANAVASAAFVLLESEAPAIAAVTPAGAEVEGRAITVDGARFGRAGAGQRLLLSGRPLAVTDWGPERVVAPLPTAPGVGGKKALTVETPWGTSPAFEYAVRELPRIASLTPAEGRPGDVVAVRGSGFGSDRGTVFMRIPGPESPLVGAVVADWQDTSITVRVPGLDQLGGGGPLEVMVETAVARSAPRPFMLLEPDRPTIGAILPAAGQVEGGEIVVSGSGFGRQNADSALVFAPPDVRATDVLAWSRTELRVRVPSVEALMDAGVKQVRVTTPWGASDARAYEIGERPKITGLSNEDVPPGAQITVTGRAFGPRPEGRIEIVTTYEEDPTPEDPDPPPTVHAVPMDPVGDPGWTETSITVRIPPFEVLRTTGLKQLVVTSRWAASAPKTIGVADRGSITCFTRIEPHARRPDLQAGLAMGLEARVHDALWLLARQDQLLELRATDGGSPIKVRVEAESGHLSRWRSGGSPPRDLPPPQTVPLEAVIERERVVPPVADSERGLPSRRLAVEAGLQFLRNVDARLRNPKKSDDYRKRFVREYPVPAPTEADRKTLDAETFRFLSVVENRAPDGDLLYGALRVALPPERGGQDRLPDRPKIGGSERDSIKKAIIDWFDWVEVLFSEGDPDAHPWDPERIEYRFAVSAELAAQDGAGEVVLEGPEYDGRRLDWHSFVRLGPDSTLRAPDAELEAVPEPEEVARTVMATPVTFPGAPVQRWWELEGRVDFGAIAPGPTDLVRLFFIHFATIYGGDWFWVPIDAVPAGSLCRVDRLVVTDTFGDETVVHPFTGGDAGDWRMFELSHRDGGRSPGLVFLPGALPSTLESAPLEDVRLFRDELANLAWAVEHTIEGPMGKPLDRHEAIQRARREAEIAAGDPPPPPPDAPPLTYTLATTVPPNWFPLLPRVEQRDGAIVARRLDRGAMRRDGSGDPIAPEGKLLEPGEPLALYDEEVPRTGARVTRLWQQGRAANGATHLWLGRRRDLGRGEGSSGLRFDAVDRR